MMRPAEGVRHRWLPRFGGVLAFAATELRVQLHEALAIFTSMVVQVVLLVFVAILAPSYFGIALLGAIVFSAFSLGQRVLNEAAYIRVDHKLNELYLASPLTPEAYFLGIAVGVFLAYLPPVVGLVVIAEAVLRFPVVTALLLAGLVLAVWLFAASMGYILSTAFHDMRAIWSYASLLYNLFGVLPPVFYPLGLWPAGLRPVALLLPPSAAAALLQNSLDPGLLAPPEIALAAGAVGVAAFGLFLITVYWARRSAQER